MPVFAGKEPGVAIWSALPVKAMGDELFNTTNPGFVLDCTLPTLMRLFATVLLPPVTSISHVSEGKLLRLTSKPAKVAPAAVTKTLPSIVASAAREPLQTAEAFGPFTVTSLSTVTLSLYVPAATSMTSPATVFAWLMAFEMVPPLTYTSFVR